MRIPCPHCGPRGHEEFTYLGDATARRPAEDAPLPDWQRYVYIRENRFGLHRELWFHAAGCQSWVVVTRDVRTHEVTGAEDAHTLASAA